MSQMVKVTNLSEKNADKLKMYALDNRTFEVCGDLLSPGASVELPADVWGAHAARYARLAELGALCAEAVERVVPFQAPAPSFLKTADTEEV